MCHPTSNPPFLADLVPLNFLAPRSGNRAETGVGGLGGRDRENGNEEEQLDGHFAYLVDDGVCLAVLAAACKGGRGEMIACACVRIS